LLDAERLVVVRNGVHSVYSPKVDPICDERVSDLIGRPLPDALDLLHVASTIPRKRIDLLLRVFAAVRKHVASARLIRVGGNFTNAQQDLIEELEIGQSIVEMPHLERRELAALYRRATILLMPSEAEGFGFPVVEALASGTPVVASDLPALREVGGTVVKYCGLGKIDGWSEAVLALAAERLERPRAWRARSIEGVRWAERFSSREYASGNLALYRELHASAH
jgi:glycosyltransferase involved in cell wall biosynthesis